jgi:EAL domain-containing protein (putative c-di-GMP-specific phosphodiesterase class I)/CheY-like chemotaxis protein
VVDDDPMIVRSVERVLKRQGYVVLTATDVEGAFAHADGDSIDAALIDYTLTRDTGLPVLEKLRTDHKKCVRILITARRDPVVYDEAINKGQIHAVLRKPFEGDDLLQTLAEGFERYEKTIVDLTERSSEEDVRQRKALVNAIRRDQLTLALQAIVDVTPGADQPVAGWEALLRPTHSEFTTPVSLLDTAEKFDRVAEVGSSVLAIACTIVEVLPAKEKLFVNLHPAQLGDPARLARDLEPYGARAKQVVLEITERSRKDADLGRWQESLALIRQGGFAVALDDLGAGYSSLVVVAETNPQYIKLDMGLVRNVHAEPIKQRLVSLVRMLGVELSSRIIAEGVETALEAQALFDCGIRWMQGFYYARPVPFIAGVPPHLP